MSALEKINDRLYAFNSVTGDWRIIKHTLGWYATLENGVLRFPADNRFTSLSACEKAVKEYEEANQPKIVRAYKLFSSYADDPLYLHSLNLALERTIYVYGKAIAEQCINQYIEEHQTQSDSPAKE